MSICGDTFMPLRPARTTVSQVSCCLRASWVSDCRVLVCLVRLASFVWMFERRVRRVAVMCLSRFARDACSSCFGCDMSLMIDEDRRRFRMIPVVALID
jgi:hypothetical protein